MKTKHQIIKSLLNSLMLPACAMLAFATFDVHAQTDPRIAAALSAESGGGLPTITNRNSDLRSQAFSSTPAIQNRGQSISTNRELPAPPQPKSAFETYVQTVTGTDLKVFGKNLFSDVPDTFAPNNAVQVNPDYVIGTGDELQIRGWGMVSIDLNATVDRSGAIYIPKVGTVRVAGIKYRDLQNYLKSAISKDFSNFDLTVSISQTRAVQIYVVGHAVRPGTYTLSAMSTLLNALFTSGGPDGIGTMRNIQLKRGNQTVTTFDLYDMLVHGDKSRDAQLQDGDVIYIPEVGPLVALTGNVKNPGIYELKGGSSLADVVDWAGGFDSAATAKQVVIEKNVDNNYQTVADITADKAEMHGRLAGIPMRPADIVRVFSPSAVPVQAQIENEYVRVAGEVKRTGVFKIHPGETLRELIARLGGVTENAYVYGTVFDRESVRRMQQQQLDEVADRFEHDLETSTAQQLASTTDKDNVAAINAQATRQHMLAEKLRSVKAKGRIVLELPGGDAQVKNLPDLALQNGDSIVVPRKPGTVDVLGAVFQQNAFMYRPHRTASDYITLAGGATTTADKSQLYVIHADGTTQGASGSSWFGGVSSTEVNPGDSIVVPEELDQGSLTRSFKDWTSILYQFGLGAAGLKVLKN